MKDGGGTTAESGVRRERKTVGGRGRIQETAICLRPGLVAEQGMADHVLSWLRRRA
jgi:hypothetical protein